MKRLLLVLLAALLAAALLLPGQARGDDNVVAVVNTHDGLDLFRASFKIVRTTQSTVDDSNTAAAVNSCTDCSSTAIAFQIVLIFSDPIAITSQNLALSLNLDCTNCVADAQAYQWLLTTGGVVHFSAAGSRRLADIYRRLQALRHEGLTPDELNAELDEMQAEIADILATDLVLAGPPAASASTTTTATPTETAGSDTSATTTPAPAPTTEATTTAPAETTTAGSTETTAPADTTTATDSTTTDSTTTDSTTTDGSTTTSP
jgi:putative peptide zinc metalloprotease protein